MEAMEKEPTVCFGMDFQPMKNPGWKQTPGKAFGDSCPLHRGSSTAEERVE